LPQFTGLEALFQQVNRLSISAGDTTTAFAAALAAQKIPVGHVELDYRTDDLFNPCREPTGG